MAFALQTNTSNDATLDIIQRLWRTKLKSITLLEKWMAKTTDLEIKAGLKAQLLDERRHLRLLGDEVSRLGGRLQGSALDQMLERPFAMIQAQSNEAYKLSAYYHGIKRYTANRCGRLIPVVDHALARVLEQIARDEAGHIRWADIRLERVKDIHEQRQIEFFVEKMEAVLESVWSKSWRQLTSVRQRLFAAAR
jgi:rubrerythrin